MCPMGTCMARTILKIRCDEEVKKEFKRFAADFKNYEQALRYLLKVAKLYRPRVSVEI